MSATEYQFRGVTFGGFNRQDVLNYVEQVFAEHNQQIWDLKNELKQAEETCAQQAAALAEAETRAMRSAEENSRLSAELAEAQKTNSGQTAELAEARSELDALRQKVAELEPGAEAYARIKDRAASLELEAHMRAQAILDEAQAHAKASCELVTQRLHKVWMEYDRLRTDVDATVSHASGELSRIQNALAGLTEAFVPHDDALDELMEGCRTQSGT